ncbi:protein phosphatase 2C domain-containing protein [Saccharopolyspora halophila]|uniref:Protein phosphatase 2C domain-containing protein n=1 Tax=Saccharopolyspora halophila TaxID=405551 RepID=A0ABN3GPJ7_9PSEU
MHRLGGELARLLTISDAPLADLLAEAIERTCSAHADTCDLANPSSPSATATVLRLRAETEYLVLADSPLVLEIDGEVRTIIDDRLDHLPDRALDTVTRLRNHPDGFWVASTEPEAAHQARHGTLPPFGRAALLTDGASRQVELFAKATWPTLLDLLTEHGPEELLTQVRRSEVTTPPSRAKPHDDATAICWSRRG